MSSQNAQRDESLARESLLRAQALLQEALQLIDQYGNAPEIGARLQDVIDCIKTKTG